MAGENSVYDSNGIAAVNDGIAETLAKVPGGEWQDEAERKADVEMWLKALGQMVTE